MSPPKKVVLIRLDKIGDLISTLPTDQLSYLQNAEVRWVIAKGLGFIPSFADPVRKYIELDKEDSWNSFQKLLGFLREYQPDMAISFQAPWWVSLALWITRIPARAGVQSQWHSFLFLNHGLRQKRSEARQHEADYNCDLVAFAFGQLENRLIGNRTIHGGYLSPTLSLQDPQKLDLKKWNLEAKKFVVVHPGMAGSALNWTVKKYIDLISFLVKDHRVVLTGTAGDEKWLKDIKETYHQHPQVLNLQNELNPEELLSLLAQALVVIVPSTGVAHMASSLGTPVISMFSPVQVQHPRRWAPRGSEVEILLPDVKCPAQFQCLGESCKYFYCLDRISVEDVLSKVRAL